MSTSPRPVRPVVLYVEDHAVNLLLMQALFERRPAVDLVCATSGYGARTLARTLSPVLLLVDLRLPDCHGQALLQDLRQLPGCARVPAIAVTADCEFDIRDSGFSELWAKPLHLPSVLGRLDAWLEGSAQSQAEPRARERPAPMGFMRGSSPAGWIEARP